MLFSTPEIYIKYAAPSLVVLLLTIKYRTSLIFRVKVATGIIKNPVILSLLLEPWDVSVLL